jgi:hypothetical protein
MVGRGHVTIMRADHGSDDKGTSTRLVTIVVILYVTVATVEDLAVEPTSPQASSRHCLRHHHRCTSVSSEARIIKKEIVLYC